jgi:hypothetical protein
MQDPDVSFCSQMGGLECVITGLMDEFHSFFKPYKYARETFTLFAVVFSFCIAIFNVTPVSLISFIITLLLY